jgi:hypothetical protein
MEDASPLVRARANVAVVRMIGLDAHFDPLGAPVERTRLVQWYRGQWERLRNSRRLAEFRQKLDRQYGPIDR